MRKLNFLKNEYESFSTKKTWNNSHRLLVGALALILVAGMTSPVFAQISNIDSFDVCLTNVAANHIATTDDDLVVGCDTAEVVGGERYAKVTWQSGPTPADPATSQIMGDSIDFGPPKTMSVSSDAGVTGLFEMRWDEGGTGLGGLDITNGGASDRIIVKMHSADAGGDMTITLMDTGAGTSSLMKSTAGGAETLEFKFSDFSAGADLTDIDKIEISLQGQLEGDYALDSINVPQMMVGGTVGSMDTTTLLVAGAQANMGLWSLALVGVVAAGAAIVYKTKSKKTEQ